MTDGIVRAKFANLNQYIEVKDPDNEEDVLLGYAIPHEELGSLLFDIDQLVKRKGGVPYTTLLEEDIEDAVATQVWEREHEA